MTNDELNERIALALGWHKHQCIDPDPHCWITDRGLPAKLYNQTWATSVDACLRDLLPVVKAKMPGNLTLGEYGSARRWQAVYLPDDPISMTVVDADTPARALCLLFLAVMEAKP